MAKDKSFTFLDHAIRCGDSLIGLNDEQLKTFSLDSQGVGITLPNFLNMIPKIMEATRLLRIRLEKIADDTISNVEEKQRLFVNIQFQTKRLNYAADRLLAASWQSAKPAERVALLRTALQEVDDRIRDVPPDTLETEGLAHREEAGCPRPFHWALEFPEVFLDRGGFDALVSNPPCMGGQKITGNLGTDYRDYLVRHIAGGRRGSADLCAYFFLRASTLLRDGGQLGFLATNTIAQGDTREVGLDQLTADGCVIPRAVPSRPWPGTANLEVAHIWLRRGHWSTPFVLDEKPVSGITSFLTEPGAVTGKPYRLAANVGKSFQGSIVLGMGFVLKSEEAKRLIEKNPRNKDVLFPYLNGEDLNSRPDQSPSRWVINFFDWPLDRETAPDRYEGPVAADYQDCLTIVEKSVKPERMKYEPKNAWNIGVKARWWQFGAWRKNLDEAIAGMERVFGKALTSKHHSFTFLSRGIVYDQTALVFALKEWGTFAVVQCEIHYQWSLEYGASLETRPRYSLTDCFEPFPFPDETGCLDAYGQAYHEFRHHIMLTRQEGLTKTYNRFHDPDETAADIKRLQDLHIEMDHAVASVYGWTDLDLGHSFHETKQGTRFTINESARREILARFLKLNHERYAEEVRQGHHDKKGKAKTPKAGRGHKSKESSGGANLFGDGENDPYPTGGR